MTTPVCLRADRIVVAAVGSNDDARNHERQQIVQREEAVERGVIGRKTAQQPGLDRLADERDSGKQVGDDGCRPETHLSPRQHVAEEGGEDRRPGDRLIAFQAEHVNGRRDDEAGLFEQAGRQRQQLRALNVAPLEIQARLLAREGKADDAIAKLKEAIEEEIKLGYSEPPLYPVPMEEVAGKVCVELKRWKEAEEFFRAALERDPGSGRAYFGLVQAQQALGKDADARDNYVKFLKAWAKADADLPEMKRAKAMAQTFGASGQ